MVSSILLTKLFMPVQRENLVGRFHLLDMLDRCLETGYRLALVSAPAGYGKTTLVSSWLHRLHERFEPQQHVHVAWLSLDAADDDPLVFWTYVLASLQQQNPKIGAQARSLLASSPAGYEDCLVSLLNDLAKDDVFSMLILDDFHFIRSAGILDSLTFFLDRMPPQFRLVLCTRSDPSLPLAQLRARGQLLELRLTDLRFSSSEASYFFNRHMGLQLDEEKVAALNERAEGWAAGLQMAALSLKGEKKLEAFIASFSGTNRYILDYLIEEVLQRQPQQVQDFLVYTCILETFSVSLCDALCMHGTQPDDISVARQQIEYLERANLFIVPLDHSREWYRYHSLFADLLKKRLEQDHPGMADELHVRASTWYENAGMLDQAIEHAFLAQDAPNAARLIDASADEMLWRGEYSWLLRWIQKLPEMEMWGHLRLLLIKAAIQASNGCLEEAESTLQHIEAQQEMSEEGQRFNRWYMGRAASVRALMACYRSDMESVRRHASVGLDSLPQGLRSPWRSAILITLGSTLLEEGDAGAACPVLREAIAGGRQVQHAMLTLEPSVHLATSLWLLGRAGEAGQVCRDALRDIEQNGWQQVPAAAKLFVNSGFILTEQHRLDDALVYLEKGLDMCRRGSHRWAFDWAASLWVRYLLARRKPELALQALYEIDQHERALDLPVWISGANAGLKAEVLVRLQRLAEAQDCLAEQGVSAAAQVDFFHPLQFQALLCFMRARGELEQAHELVQKLIRTYLDVHHMSWWLKAMIFQSTLYHIEGDDRQALMALSEALPLAIEGYQQHILDEARYTAPVLENALAQDVQSEIARRLLQMIRGETAQPHVTSRAVPADSLEPVLSARELQVLNLVVQGLGNKEIAARLYLTLRTVKYHTGNIYRKLGVSSRAQAIGQAQRLGILAELPQDMP